MAADVPTTRSPDPLMWGSLSPQNLIGNPKEAINVFDFELVCRKNVPPAHFGYMASGIDDEVTLRANREAFLKYYLRPRRMNDVSKVDMSMSFFGTTYASPICIAPTGGNKAYHVDGELAVSRAAMAGDHLQILSTASTVSINDAIAARGAPVWFQLYATSSWEVARGLVKRAESAGAPVVAVTVDRVGGRNQETLFRLRRTDLRECKGCHESAAGGGAGGDRDRRPNYAGIDMSTVTSMQSANMTWDFIARMRDTTKMKIILKGIVTEEDAQLCLKYGVDGIHVSNHGGRSEDNGRGAIEYLPEVAKVARGKVPILFDSGVRRGTDIFKAMALGATAVCIGRPYLWGLGAFGQPGVERVLEILREEFTGVMQQMGAPNIAAIMPEMVRQA